MYKKNSISEIGNSELRKMLCFPSLTAKKHVHNLSAFATKLKNKGKAKVSIVATVIKKLVHILYGV